MSSSPKLTAVVLCYNKSKEFPRFWSSLTRQTRKPDQAVVVDDCSTDAPASYYRDIVAPTPLIRLPWNGGQGRARNMGTDLARGDFIIFLDGDIEMKPDMLHRMQHALLEHPEASIAYSHYDRVGTRRDHVRAMPWSLHALQRQNYLSMMSMIRRKDMPTPPFDESLERYEDWDLWLRMASEGKKGILIPEILFTAYYKEGDISGTRESAAWYTIVRQKHRLTV